MLMRQTVENDVTKVPVYGPLNFYDPSSIPDSGLDASCGLSSIVVFHGPLDVSPGTSVFPSQQKPTFDL